jgi:hypothetical protein
MQIDVSDEDLSDYSSSSHGLLSSQLSTSRHPSSLSTTKLPGSSWPLVKTPIGTWELQITALSRKKIPFHWGQVSKHSHFAKLPASVTTPLGGQDSTARKDALLVTSGCPVNVTVPVHSATCKCGKGNACALYDGNEDEVMSLDGQILWSWELMQRWWVQYTFLPITYHGWWKAHCRWLRICGDISQEQEKQLFGLRKKFQEACVNFILLMHLDFANLNACCDGENGIYTEPNCSSRHCWKI